MIYHCKTFCKEISPKTGKEAFIQHVPLEDLGYLWITCCYTVKAIENLTDFCFCETVPPL